MVGINFAMAMAFQPTLSDFKLYAFFDIHNLRMGPPSLLPVSDKARHSADPTYHKVMKGNIPNHLIFSIPALPRPEFILLIVERVSWLLTQLLI